MNLEQTCKAIRDLKVQGAENIATAALLALQDTAKHTKVQSKESFLLQMDLARMKLINTRPTEPELRNYCNSIIHFLEDFPEESLAKTKHAVKECIKHTLKEKEKRKERLTMIGSLYISSLYTQKEVTIYTHCHASSVTAIIKKINKRKRVIVHNTETRPLFQGRKTAEELIQEGIPVIHFVDAAMKEALKDVDCILIGADAFTSEGVYNKVGSELLAHLANHEHIPLYVCASVWKWDMHREHIEERDGKEVWEHAPKEVQIKNPAFEKIHWKHVKRVICEEGVLKPKQFIKRAKQEFS